MIVSRLRTSLLFAAACATAAVLAGPVYAVDGDLDPTFGGDGRQMTMASISSSERGQ